MVNDDDRLAIEIALTRYSEQFEDLRKHEERQTQSFNFALVVYGAELVTAGTVVSTVLGVISQHFPLDEIVACVLPVFQVFFPALMFPLALLYLDVSIYNQITHKEVREYLDAVIDGVNPHLQKTKRGPEFERSAIPLRKQSGISLDRIWLLRHLLFLYAPALGAVLPLFAYYLVYRLGKPVFYSWKINAMAMAGFLFSLLALWGTLAGILAAYERRIYVSGKPYKALKLWAPIRMLVRPWHI